MKKNGFKRVLSIALTAVLVAGTITFPPHEASKVQAATATVKKINLGTAGFTSPTSTGSDATEWEGSKVYYGNKLWRVLDPSHDSNGTAGSAFLFSDELQGSKAYNDNYDHVTWEYCSLRMYLNGIDNIGKSGTFLRDTFTAKEQNAIKITKVGNPANPDYDKSYAGDDTEDKLFLLSLAEVKNTVYGFGSDATRILCNKVLEYENHFWWLRSPGEDNLKAAAVCVYNGKVDSSGCAVSSDFDYCHYVCPAFNLNLDSVLFSSASGVSKSTFTSVETDNVGANTWKLTLKDDSETVGVTDGQTVLQNGSTVTVPYIYTGDDVSQISIMITDKAYTESDAGILYYGALTTTLNTTTKAGTGTFTLPAGLPDGYKIYMMAEDVNESNLTDYSSLPVKINPIVPSNVTIINPAESHITRSLTAGNGTAAQTGLTGAMTPVIYTADDGYYFPATYSVTGSNGISVTRDSYTQITVSGTPADNVTITLIAAMKKSACLSAAVTDITTPAAGTALDTKATCATTGVDSTTPAVTWTKGEEAATGNAGYNTAYTASVTLTPADDYEFASDVTATVNGNAATSVTRNDNGTITVTYEFPATDKAKLISITAPAGITVANGTAYADMGLPANVAIVTEENTETTAAVVWNTTTPAGGSYDPALPAKQSVTLNGTVTCPSNIDQNGVTLTTTITVTILSAETQATPTPTQAPVTPTPTQVPATPTPTQAPATPTPTQAPATPTPTQAPATPTSTQAPATPTPTQVPATPTPTQAPVVLVPTAAPAVPVPDTTTVTSQAATTVSTTQTVTITGTTVDVTTVPVATTTTAQKITPEVTTTTTTAAVITPEVTTTTTTAAVIPAKEVETPKEEIEAPDDTTPLGYYSNPGDEPAKITIDIPNKYQGNDFNYYLVNADGDKIYPDKNSDGKLTFTVGSKDEFLLVLDDPNPLGIVDPADNLPKTGTLPVMLYGVSGFAILLAGAYVLSSEQRKFRK